MTDLSIAAPAADAPVPTPAPTAAPAVDEADLSARLGALSLEQKVRLLTGADFWALHPEPAAGLRRLVVSDGPAGVRGETWDERDTSANVPSPTALAATWDVDRVERIGRLLAFEARRKGVDVLLAPTVNLHRTPYGGRHFENLSEDPYLTARIGVAYVQGVQAGGVGATVKHFVANDSETDRMSLNALVDERTLHELYLAPFEAIVREAGVWAVMAAYNQVNGTTMTENPLLRDVLHDAWGFDGVTMSDWFATRSTVAAGNGGLDLAMPGPAGPWGQALVDAVLAGDVDLARIDDHVLRILRLAARVGALEGIAAVAQAPTYSDAQIAAELRSAAAAGFVLVRNQGVLPIPADVTRVAVLGPNAEVGRTLGGGSATVYPPYAVSPLDGIRAALAALPGGAEVTSAPGVRAHARTSPARDVFTARPDGSAGVEIRFVDAAGVVLATQPRTGGTFNWLAGFGTEVSGQVATIQIAATVRAVEAGTYEIGGSGLGRYRLTVDGEQVFDVQLALPPGADIVEGMMTPPQSVHPVTLAAGESVDVVLTHDVGSGGLQEAGVDLGTMLQFNIEPPHASDDDAIAHAVELARAADVAVVVVGTNEEVESEGYDRDSLALPGRQDELVRRVAAANPSTVVVVNAGAPVLMPWADEVGAVLLVWFPGQELGNALADVLLGAVEPGGRLPTTWPVSEDRLPSTTPIDGRVVYGEGLLVGYRDPNRDALYAFGHGLGYTTWEYTALEVPVAPMLENLRAGVAEVRVRNTGTRRGREVVQVYLSRPGSDLERPVRWLAGFAAVEADPGEVVTVQVSLPVRGFEHWDVDTHGWDIEHGAFQLEAGSSSADLPLACELVWTEGL
ncbi:beta-glucosidase family protein [Pengzhenrongella frigida]|uniref:Beta-glucosidase n=1 Tax=Pengzhenrongella frigida TaxID=1259133 RepID=A0A4Q5MYJ9_9MICO|nr:glycoside hydrolase family 3 C-terminal domain-containing protein [Cellulomonas sp. HLT2-17]RYV50788.1 beta-glucosidase [Cellulomonas sp. HLT2-17]